MKNISHLYGMGRSISAGKRETGINGIGDVSTSGTVLCRTSRVN